jgi:carbamoyltransferase
MEKFYFLGFMSYCSHDPSAAMVEVTKSGGGVDFKFIHFEEGMLSRRKQSYHFPTRSVKACLDYFGITLDKVTKITTDFMDSESFIDTSLNYRHLVGDYIRQNLKISSNQISKPIHHHLAHAIGALVGSGLKDTALLAIDGLGSKQSTHSIFSAKDGKINQIYSQTTPGIGALYNLITQLIGFKSGEEGKTMGLSPYGSELGKEFNYPNIDFQRHSNGYSCDFSKIISRSPDLHLLTDFNITQYAKKNLYNDYRAYLAYHVQKELEEVLLYLAKEISINTGHKNLCISGGVGLNCVANELLTRAGIFENIYVMPDSADSGLSVGLAFHGVKEYISQSEWNTLLNKYKHPKFSSENAINTIASPVLSSLPWKDVNLKKLVDEIQENAVIAIYDGGFEYGPRALGRRSFIASASSTNMKEILNSKIKHREAYRPFAPICLLEDFSLFFVSSHLNHEFMSYAVATTKFARATIPAVVHHDGTSRVQIATKECGIVFDLLVEQKARTGIGVLINTSLNDNDEPIVFDAIDAFSCFIRTNADILVLNNKMLFRKDITSQIENLRTSITRESAEKNTSRFREALDSLLTEPASDLKSYLSSYLTISEYSKNHKTRLRFERLIADINTGTTPRFKRLVVAKNELITINDLIRDYFSTPFDIAESIIEIYDTPDSIPLLDEGDLLISYNLSNALRDWCSLRGNQFPKVYNFYLSSDYRLRRLDISHSSRKEILNELLTTYEGDLQVTIEDTFTKYFGT